MTGRGGPQLIPRPPDWRPGSPAPWAELTADRRMVTAAQLRRAFTGRVGRPSWVESEGTSRPSAVLAPFYEQDGRLWVVLTRRSWDLRNHTGEVSFPGGRAEDGETPVATALREAQEEIGLDPALVEVLGELDHLMTVSSRSFIVPLVGLLPGGRPHLVPNSGEVDAVLHVPVSELLDDAVFREERWIFPSAPPWGRSDDGSPDRRIFFFELIGDTLWGATASMLRHLLAHALGLATGIDHP